MFLFINITFSYTIPDVISLSSRKFFAGCFLGGLQRIQFPVYGQYLHLLKPYQNQRYFSGMCASCSSTDQFCGSDFYSSISHHCLTILLYIFYTLHGRILITKFNPTAITYIVCWCLTIISPWCFWLFSTTYSTNIKFIIFVH